MEHKDRRSNKPQAEDLHYGHPRMPLSDRAKIFIPFDPLKGFREALTEQEHLAEQRHESKGWTI